MRALFLNAALPCHSVTVCMLWCDVADAACWLSNTAWWLALKLGSLLLQAGFVCRRVAPIWCTQSHASGCVRALHIDAAQHGLLQQHVVHVERLVSSCLLLWLVCAERTGAWVCVSFSRWQTHKSGLTGAGVCCAATAAVPAAACSCGLSLLVFQQ